MLHDCPNFVRKKKFCKYSRKQQFRNLFGISWSPTWYRRFKYVNYAYFTNNFDYIQNCSEAMDNGPVKAA